ncbi:MAG TPA: PAS domain S-box protein [Bacteroidota bacterium]|nr:PAS domain S-box protein [Bacteroidota bacterium]
MLVADLGGSFRAANGYLLRMFGIPLSGRELPGPMSFVGPDQKWPFLRFIVRARKSRNATIDLGGVSAEGRAVPVRVRSMPVEGGLTLFLVEENRANEEAGRKNAELIEEVGSLFGDHPVPLCYTDRRKISAANAAFARLYGAASGWSGAAALSSCFPQKTLKQLREGMEGALSAGERLTVRGHLLRADGSELPARISIAPAGRGHEGQCVVTVEDVSEFTSRIGTLEENDRRFRSIAEQLSLPVALLQGREIVYCNPQCVELLGPGGADTIRGRSIVDFIPGEERDGFDGAFTKFLASRQASQRVDTTIVRTEGGPLAVRLTLRKLQGVPDAGILVELEDVTERRREEERLSGMQEGTERIKSILEAATGTLEYEKLVHVALDRSLDVLGWSGGAVFVIDAAAKSCTSVYARHIPKKLLETISVLPSTEGLGGYVSKTLESHVFSLEKYPSYLPFRMLFRRHRIRQISLIPLVHAEAPIGFILGISVEGRKADAVSLDTLTTLGRQLGNAMVNARKLAAVRESEHRLHTVVDSLAGIVYTSGPDGVILTIDAAVSGILGYTPREFDRNRSLFLSLIHEEDKKIYLERVTGSEGLGSGFVREYRVRPKAKAAFRWMRDSVSVMRDLDGKVAGFTGILSDVTEDREKFRAMMTEHTILRTVQDALPDGVAVFDDGAACVDWNPTMELLTGTARAAAVGRNANDLVPLPASLGSDGFQLAVAARKPSRLGLVESSAHPGTWYESFLVPVPGRGEAGPGFLLRYTDVTARQAELDHLLQSEKILLNVINAMDDVMMITDLSGRVVEVNQAFLKVMRYPRSQVVGQEFPYRWLVEKDMSRFMVWISRIREQSWLHDFDVTWVARGGGEVQMSLNTTLIRNSMGEPVAMLNIARDISERVRLTHDVEARNNQIEMINRIITLANHSNDFAEIFRAVAGEMVRLMSVHAIFTVAPGGAESPFSQAVAFDGEPLEIGSVVPFAELLRAGGSDVRPDEIIPDLLRDPRTAEWGGLGGRIRSAVVVPIEGGGGTSVLMAVASRDPHAYGEEHAEILRPLASQLGGIIGRLRLFRQVVSDSTYVRNLLDSIDSPVYTVDKAFTITRINRAGIDFLRDISGDGSGPFEGSKLFDILPDSPLKGALKRAIDSVETGSEPHYTEEVTLAGPGRAGTTRLTVNTLKDGDRTNGYVFSHADITALKATEKELRDRANQLITLHEISAVISNAFDIGSILASALTLLKNTLRARGIMVYLANTADGGLELEHQEGFIPDDIREVSKLHPDLSITGDVVKRRVPRYIGSNVSGDTRTTPSGTQFLARHALEAMAVVPIVSKEKVLGALDVFYDAPHEFTEQERHVLNLAGNQLGAAIENVHLYQELTAQVERLSVLFELSQKLTSLLDTGEIYRAVFDHIRRVVVCERCSISLLDEATGAPRLMMRAVREGLDYRVDYLPRDGEAGMTAAVAEVAASGRTHQGQDGGSVVVPMVSEENIIGVIEIVRGDARPFDEVQIRLLESVGSLTAIAIQKASLYEETVRTSTQIEQRNRELDDFTYVVSHDLKEPLISIEGFSRILQMDYSGVIRAEGKEYLDSLVGATTRMKGLIDDLLMLSRVSRPTESFRQVDLSAVVAEIRTDMEFVIRKRRLDFRVDPGLPQVYGDETQLKILFRNLIGNAVKFNDKADPFIEVGFRYQENNSYLFWVKDNGIGIEPEFFEKIFVIFQRLHRREEFEGSGAGLAIVKKIIEIHQGKIWVESQRGTGSMFCFTLPASAGT